MQGCIASADAAPAGGAEGDDRLTAEIVAFQEGVNDPWRDAPPDGKANVLRLLLFVQSKSAEVYGSFEAISKKSPPLTRAISSPTRLVTPLAEKTATRIFLDIGMFLLFRYGYKTPA